MNATMTTNGQKTTKGFKGFAVICPLCHDEENPVTLNLRDLNEITCPGCGESFTARQAYEKAVEQAAAWEAVVRWVELAANA